MRTWPLCRFTSQLSSPTPAAPTTASAMPQGSLSIQPSAASAAARAAASAAPAALAEASSAAAAPRTGSARASDAAATPISTGALTLTHLTSLLAAHPRPATVMAASAPPTGAALSVTQCSGPCVARCTATPPRMSSPANTAAAVACSPLASSRAICAAAEFSVSRCVASMIDPIESSSTSSTAGSATANSAVTEPRSSLSVLSRPNQVLARSS